MRKTRHRTAAEEPPGPLPPFVHGSRTDQAGYGQAAGTGQETGQAWEAGHDPQSCGDSGCDRLACRGYRLGYQKGYQKGYEEGWQAGYAQGYKDGYAAGQAASR